MLSSGNSLNSTGLSKSAGIMHTFITVTSHRIQVHLHTTNESFEFHQLLLRDTLRGRYQQFHRSSPSRVRALLPGPNHVSLGALQSPYCGEEVREFFLHIDFVLESRNDICLLFIKAAHPSINCALKLRNPDIVFLSLSDTVNTLVSLFILTGVPFFIQHNHFCCMGKVKANTGDFDVTENNRAFKLRICICDML